MSSATTLKQNRNTVTAINKVQLELANYRYISDACMHTGASTWLVSHEIHHTFLTCYFNASFHFFSFLSTSARFGKTVYPSILMA